MLSAFPRNVSTSTSNRFYLMFDEVQGMFVCKNRLFGCGAWWRSIQIAACWDIKIPLDSQPVKPGTTTTAHGDGSLVDKDASCFGELMYGLHVDLLAFIDRSSDRSIGERLWCNEDLPGTTRYICRNPLEATVWGLNRRHFVKNLPLPLELWCCEEKWKVPVSLPIDHSIHAPKCPFELFTWICYPFATFSNQQLQTTSHRAGFTSRHIFQNTVCHIYIYI